MQSKSKSFGGVAAINVGVGGEASINANSWAPLGFEEKCEVDADAYYTAMEALEVAEAQARSSHRITRSDIARILDMDKSSVTKILNGSTRNITLRTFFLLMKAMNRKVVISSYDMTDVNITVDACAIPAVPLGNERLLTYSDWLPNDVVTKLLTASDNLTLMGEPTMGFRLNDDLSYRLTRSDMASSDA